MRINKTRLSVVLILLFSGAVVFGETSSSLSGNYTEVSCSGTYDLQIKQTKGAYLPGKVQVQADAQQFAIKLLGPGQNGQSVVIATLAHYNVGRRLSTSPDGAGIFANGAYSSDATSFNYFDETSDPNSGFVTRDTFSAGVFENTLLIQVNNGQISNCRFIRD